MGDFWHEIKDWIILIIGGFVTWNHTRQTKAEDRISDLEKNSLPRAEHNLFRDKIDEKLDRILDKLDKKADKP
jgi:hypothetical protein